MKKNSRIAKMKLCLLTRLSKELDEQTFKTIEEIVNQELHETIVPYNSNLSLFEDIAQELVDLHIKKNKDYGNSFGKTFDNFGLVSALTRLSDKFYRVINLFKCGKREVEDEPIEETLRDLANYSIMTLVELRKRKIKDGENRKL